MFRLIHTSDWHLGRSLFDRKRYAEQAAFLDWLAGVLSQERADALLVCGDVFDTSTPSHTAQALYYGFLCQVAHSSCRHVVVTAGNHDSPAFLEAPRALLEALRIQVVGYAAADPADEVRLLSDAEGKPALLVGAVPYLRDREVRTVEAGETVADKSRKLVEGIAAHYQAVCEAAGAIRDPLSKPVPLVLTGHLFAAGGTVTDGDGVRELYVGSLARVGTDAFPLTADYVALGHLHAPQGVAADGRVRYSGAPYALGFGEAGREKQVLRVDFDGGAPVVTPLPVPVFQTLERVQGDRETIDRRLEELKAAGVSAWLEVVYEGNEPAGSLRERLEETVADTGLEILRIQNSRAVRLALSAVESGETLDDLDPEEVFARCLEARKVPDERREELWGTYLEVLASVREGQSQSLDGRGK